MNPIIIQNLTTLDQSVLFHRQHQWDSNVQVSWSESWDSFLNSVLMRYTDYNHIFVSTPLSTGHRIVQSKRVPAKFSMSLFGESRPSPMTGSSKFCEICDITNKEGVVRVANCIGGSSTRLVTTENYASIHSVVMTNSQVFGQSLNFIITPTLYRYYLNHMLLIPTVHINTHALMYNYTLFRSLIRVMDLIQSRSSNSLNFIFNGAMGSDPGHLHLHITDQKITYIDNDIASNMTEYPVYTYRTGVVDYIRLVRDKTNYEELFKNLSLIYNWQIEEMLSPQNVEYAIGIVFKIINDKCKIYVTKGKQFVTDWDHKLGRILPHTQVFMPFDTINDRASIEGKIMSTRPLYMSLDINNPTPYNQYPSMTKWDHTFIIDIHKSLSLRGDLTYCDVILEMLKEAYSKRTAAELRAVWKDLYPYLLNNLIKCPTNNTRLETALVNLNMDYYNKLFKDKRSIYLDGALAARLFGNLDNILRTVARDPDLVYSLENTRIGDESAYGVIRPATVKDNNNFSMIVKMARHTNDVNSQELFVNSYEVGIALNKIREHIPNFILTLGKVDCKIDTVIGRKLADRICYADGDTAVSIIAEKIHDSISLETYFSDYSRKELEYTYQTYTLVYNTMIALVYANLMLMYSHNDLHFGNILVTKTEVGSHIYKLGDKTYRLITNLIPIIIDYDSNYVKTPTFEARKVKTGRFYDYDNCRRNIAIYADIFMLLSTFLSRYFAYTIKNVIELPTPHLVREVYKVYMDFYGFVYEVDTDIDSLVNGLQALPQQRKKWNASVDPYLRRVLMYNYLLPDEVRTLKPFDPTFLLDRMSEIYDRYIRQPTGPMPVYNWGDHPDIGCVVDSVDLSLKPEEIENLTRLYESQEHETSDAL